MPYDPHVQPRGSDYIAQAGIQAGQSIAEGIKGMRQRLLQTQAMRSMAVQGLGMDPDQVDKMNLNQLQGTLAGAALKRSNVGQQLEQQLMAEKTKGAALERTIMEGDQAAMQRLQAIRQARTQASLPAPGAPGSPGGPDGPPNPNVRPYDASDPRTMMEDMNTAGVRPQIGYQMMESARAAAQAHRYEAQGNMYDARAAGNGNGDQPIVPQTLPGGYVGFRLPGSNQMDIRQDMSAGPQANQVEDEQGNVAGTVINMGGKNIFRPAKPAIQNKLNQAVDDKGKALPGIYINPNTGQHIDMRSSMQKDYGGGAGAPAAPASGGVSGKAPTWPVAVVHPDGSTGVISADQVDEALKQGYKLAQ